MDFFALLALLSFCYLGSVLEVTTSRESSCSEDFSMRYVPFLSSRFPVGLGDGMIFKSSSVILLKSDISLYCSCG